MQAYTVKHKAEERRLKECLISSVIPTPTLSLLLLYGINEPQEVRTELSDCHLIGTLTTELQGWIGFHQSSCTLSPLRGCERGRHWIQSVQMPSVVSAGSEFLVRCCRKKADRCVVNCCFLSSAGCERMQRVWWGGGGRDDSSSRLLPTHKHTLPTIHIVALHSTDYTASALSAGVPVTVPPRRQMTRRKKGGH